MVAAARRVRRYVVVALATAVTVQGIIAIAEPQTGSRLFAVMVGIGEYQDAKDPKLRYAAADVLALRDYIASIPGPGNTPQMSVLINQDATLKNIRTALGTFLPKNATSADTVLIFFSGHGASESDLTGRSEDGLRKYLVPFDAEPDNLYATGFPMDEMPGLLDRIAADKMVIVLDTCFSGESGKTLNVLRGARNMSIRNDFLTQIAGSGKIILTSSQPREISVEVEELGHGLFSYFFIEGLKGRADLNGDGVVSVDELYTYVYQNVSSRARQAGVRQNPMKLGVLTGEMILAVKRDSEQLARSGALSLRVNVPGVLLTVGGSRIGATSGGVFTGLPSGWTDVEITKAGYLPLRERLLLRPGRLVNVDVELRKNDKEEQKGRKGSGYLPAVSP